MIFRGAIYLVNRGANSLSFSSRDMKVAKGIDFISLNMVVKCLGMAVRVRLTYIHTVPN